MSEPERGADRLPFLATQAGAPYEGISSLPVSILLDNVRSMYNVGAFFRTADAAGCEKLYLCGITGRPPKPAISKTALGSEETVAWEYHAQASALIRELHKSGHEVAAIETSRRAVDLYDWQPNFPVCLLFGHETEGLGAELLDLCDTHVRIPMLGRKHSLNVATAGGVVIYELLRKYRRMFESATIRR
jgi:tRNA G18 (ribose-2'-O)-methylase SpoU